MDELRKVLANLENAIAESYAMGRKAAKARAHPGFVDAYVSKRRAKADAMPRTSLFGWDWGNARFELTSEEYDALVEEFYAKPS